MLEVGDTVSFAGNPSTRTARRMYVTNLLVSDGREILLRGNVPARWPAARAVGTDVTFPRTTSAPATGSGFFDKVLVPTREGRAPEWVRNPPLTPAAREGKAAYDEVVDDPVLGCVSPGMPRVMLRSGPYAVRFIERGTDLVLQNEWFEIDRLIHMDGRAPAADQAYAPLGYSAGRWDGETLEITTTHIDWPYFELYGLVGVPQTRAMRIVERFTPRDGGATVQYDFTATDPGAFTGPVTYENYVTFRWQPSLEFLPYDCVEDERRPRRCALDSPMKCTIAVRNPSREHYCPEISESGCVRLGVWAVSASATVRNTPSGAIDRRGVNPLGWAVWATDLDRGASMVVFELQGTDVAERAV